MSSQFARGGVIVQSIFFADIIKLQGSYGQSEALKSMVHYEIPTSSQLTRYLYVYARFSIAANAGAMLKSDGERPAMDASTFARVTQVFRQSHGYATIADVSLCFGHKPPPTSLYHVAYQF